MAQASSAKETAWEAYGCGGTSTGGRRVLPALVGRGAGAAAAAGAESVLSTVLGWTLPPVVAGALAAVAFAVFGWVPLGAGGRRR